MNKNNQIYMKFKNLLLLIPLALFVFFVFTQGVMAAPPPMFTLTADEAQGVGNNEFYEGRCFRVDINLHTNGVDTGGADAIIQYDNTNVTVVNSDCSTPATDIYSDGLYDVYPSTGNTVSGSEITLSAYENPGNSYSNSSLTRYGYFYILVDSPEAGFALNFDYTPGSTVDTNIAELGTGNDIIASVEDLTLDLLTDIDDPYFDGFNPADGDIDVPVEAAISYNMKDDMTGIDISTAAVTVNQGGGAVSETISSSCVTTNANRVPQCSAIVNPGGYFPYMQLVTVEADVCDLGDPTQHCSNTTWSFTTEDDVDAPYVEEENPADGETGVSGATDVVFHIKDYKNNAGVIPGLGVDINTVEVTVDGIDYSLAGPNTFSYSGTSEDYTITIDPVSEFPENYTVNVSVDGGDLHSPANVMATHNYSFMTSDNDAPFVDNEDPTPDSVDVVQDSNVVFQIHDTGAGVDLNNLVVEVAGETYTLSGANTFTATPISAPNDYEITIDPITDFSDGQAILVQIDAQDLASPINYMSTHIYVFGAEGASSGVCPPCDSCCPACPPCSPSSGGGNTYVAPRVKDININQINENSVLVTWRTNQPGSSRVVYGTESVISQIDDDNYGYQNSTITKNDQGLIHSVIIDGLEAGKVYYFLPVSQMGALEYTGEEVSWALRFQTIHKFEEVEKIVEVSTPVECPVCSEEEFTCPTNGILAYQEENKSKQTITLIDGVVLDKLNKFVYEVDKNIILEKNHNLILEGHAEPNQTFILTFEPQLAMSPITTDENGNWSYEVSQVGLVGEYKVKALLPDDSGHLLENLIGHFVVREVSEEEEVTPLNLKNNEVLYNSSFDLDEVEWFIILSILLLGSLLINLFLYFRRIKK